MKCQTRGPLLHVGRNVLIHEEFSLQQSLSSTLTQEIRVALEDLRAFVLDAYKAAMQKSVLRLRKLTLAGEFLLSHKLLAKA